MSEPRLDVATIRKCHEQLKAQERVGRARSTMGRTILNLKLEILKYARPSYLMSAGKVFDVIYDSETKAQLSEVDKLWADFMQESKTSSKLAEGVNLTISGVVKFPGGYMHPSSFKEMFGEEMYQELLARPRVVCEYDYDDEDEEEEKS